MRYKQALTLSSSDFKRLYGVSHETLEKMKEIVLKAKLGKRGCHSKLSIADQVLLTLQYWREYRTFFHISQDWGIHESTAWRIVKRIEDVLIKAEELHLPSKRQLQQNEEKIEIIVVDVAATEIERPKKNKKTITVVNRSVILSKCN
jgi:Helix-turn-helix of DDE superfamily endonuclease